VTEQPDLTQARAHLRAARRALGVIRGYTIIGLALAVGLGVISFFLYEREIPKWICRLGAMGVLLGATIGLNVMDRIVRGRITPLGVLAVVLFLIAAALLAVGLSSIQYGLGAAWSPLVAAMFVVVLGRIFLRLRTPPPAEKTDGHRA
jgi:hypothetical protein